MKLKLTTMLLALGFSATLYAQELPTRTISSNVTQVVNNKSETYMKCVGAGRAHEGLRGDWQRQLATLQSEAPFDYIRFHGLLTDDMGVYFKDKDGKETYNFQYIDELYDFLLSVNIKPFIELGFMPNDMASGDQTIFYWKGNVTPPENIHDWCNLIKAFTEHLTERYGRKEVASWYFEVWNEPNLGSFFTGTMDDYFEMYEAAARAIKSVDGDYRVGGPATAGNGWIKEFIEHCEKENLPLDFISTHTYGVHGFLDEYGTSQLRLGLQEDPVAAPVNNTRKLINEMNREDLELHYTEWSSSYSPRDRTHDTYMNAAYVLDALRHVRRDVNSMSYWTFTDIFEESGVPTEPLHGGFGLITMNGLKKPTYFSYRYLSELGDEELKNSDENSWVCKDENGNIQILAYDLTMPEYKDFEHNNQIFNLERIPAEIGDLNVALSGLHDGHYNVEVYKTGYRHNDIQTMYVDLGHPHNISPAQHKAMELNTQNAPVSLQVVEVKNGKFSMELPMRENDVYFINLRKL